MSWTGWGSSWGGSWGAMESPDVPAVPSMRDSSGGGMVNDFRVLQTIRDDLDIQIIVSALVNL